MSMNNSELREFKKELVSIAERNWHDILAEFNGDMLTVINDSNEITIDIQNKLFHMETNSVGVVVEFYNSYVIIGSMLNDIVESFNC